MVFTMQVANNSGGPAPKAATDNATTATGAARAGRGLRPLRAGRGGSHLELALLGILGDAELHGYELKKRLDTVLPPWSSVSFGSLYPALNRLERSGDVRSVADDEPSHDSGPTTPSTGTLSGELATFRSRLADRSTRPARTRRGRKVYSITADGRARLVDQLAEGDPADDRTFVLQIAFGRHLGANQRLSVFARRKAELSQRLDTARADTATDHWQEILRQRTVNNLNDEIAWIDELMATQPTAPNPAGVPATDPPTVPGKTILPATHDSQTTGGRS